MARKGKNVTSGNAIAARVSRNKNLKFMYVLKESVYQKGNPNVIPADMKEFALKQVQDYVSTPMPKSK